MPDPKESPRRRAKPPARSDTFIVGCCLIGFGALVALYNAGQYLRLEGKVLPLGPQLEQAEKDITRHALVCCGGVIMAAIGMSIVTLYVPSETLRKQVASLGHVKGMSFGEVQEALGRPNGREVRDDGSVVVTWRTKFYSVSYKFLDDMCEGLVRESDE